MCTHTSIVFVSACVAVFLSIGCGGSRDSTVSGKVTWNGQSLAYGFISFSPVDGATKTSGSQIEDGHYRATDVPPGEKYVQIMAADPPRVVQGSSDILTNPPSIVIPHDAKGNGVKRTIEPGEQNLDFDLTSS